MNARKTLVCLLVAVAAAYSASAFSSAEDDDEDMDEPRLIHPVITQAQARGFAHGCLSKVELGPLFQSERVLIGTVIKACSSDAEIEVGILVRDRETDEVTLITGKVSVSAEENMAIFTCALPESEAADFEVMNIQVIKIVRLLSA